MISPPVYDRAKDGNVFEWLITAAQIYRERRQVESNAAKEASAELKRMDATKVAD